MNQEQYDSLTPDQLRALIIERDRDTRHFIRAFTSLLHTLGLMDEAGQFALNGRAISKIMGDAVMGKITDKVQPHINELAPIIDKYYSQYGNETTNQTSDKETRDQPKAPDNTKA